MTRSGLWGVVSGERSTRAEVGGRAVQHRTAVVLEVLGGGITVSLPIVVLCGGTVSSVP